jgi:aminoglycoside 3-N-acetyltransferase
MLPTAMPRSDRYIPYGEIIDRIDVGAGDVLVVSSDVLKLAICCREHGERFDPDRFIDSLVSKVTEAGTVLFPTFTWDFCKGSPYDRRFTPSRMGALTNAALKRPDFRRTRHPIYSFAVWGQKQAELCSLDNVDSWSEDSPFGWLYRAHAKNLFVGIDYKQAFTFDHYTEQKVGVDYRFHKTFSGKYVDSDGHCRHVGYRMYVRDLSRKIATYVSPQLDTALTNAGLYTAYTINGIYFGLVDLHGACDIMEHDLRTGGGLIYTAPEQLAS